MDKLGGMLTRPFAFRSFLAPIWLTTACAQSIADGFRRAAQVPVGRPGQLVTCDVARDLLRRK